MGVDNQSKNHGYRVKRQDVARSEIETAIRLYAAGDDYISANLLSWAAADMTAGIARTRGLVPFHDELEDRIVPEYIKEWRNKLKEAYNFSKHADRDPEAELPDFRPEAGTWTLFGGILNYDKIYKTTTMPMLVFQHWFFCRNPDVALPPLSDSIPQMSRNFGAQIDGSLNSSMTYIAEIIDESLKNEAFVRSKLGESWSAKIEPFERSRRS